MVCSDNEAISELRHWFCSRLIWTICFYCAISIDFSVGIRFWLKSRYVPNLIGTGSIDQSNIVASEVKLSVLSFSSSRSGLTFVPYGMRHGSHAYRFVFSNVSLFWFVSFNFVSIVELSFLFCQIRLGRIARVHWKYNNNEGKSI